MSEKIHIRADSTEFEAAMKMTVEATIKERNGTHGDPLAQAKAAQAIKNAIVAHTSNDPGAMEQECLDMIAVKISRIITGDPTFNDHWHDIQGYAKLAEDVVCR